MMKGLNLMIAKSVKTDFTNLQKKNCRFQNKKQKTKESSKSTKFVKICGFLCQMKDYLPKKVTPVFDLFDNKAVEHNISDK